MLLYEYLYIRVVWCKLLMGKPARSHLYTCTLYLRVLLSYSNCMCLCNSVLDEIWEPLITG